MDRTKLLDLKRADLPNLLERTFEVAPMDARRKIFVNRNLRLDKIDVIGFDMDYTLAIYKKQKIEELAFHCTVTKLIDKKGYPEAIRAVRYEPDRVIRGLVVDKTRGNILKMDRYGHIGRVLHGREDISKDDRIKLYRTKKLELDPAGFGWVDTLFALPEACLFSQLVDFFDAQHPPGANGANGSGGNGAKAPTYGQLYHDVRTCIDEAHADDSIKRVIRANPAEFIEKDTELAYTLHRFRSSGKRLFVLTNSHYDYTEPVMRFLLHGALEGYPTWRHFFDFIVVGAGKPAFFNGKQAFHKLDEASGKRDEAAATTLEKSKIYHGGNLRDFEQLAKIGGERVLYVGDHIYGDILRSKRSSLWRTAMVIPELEDIVWHQQLYASDMSRFTALEDEMRRIDYEINYYKLLLSSVSRLRDGAPPGPTDPAEATAIEEATQHSRDALDDLKGRLRTIVAEHQEIEKRIDESANRHWGMLFAEGGETSLFGKQVEDYACVYTSRVSNFLYYSPVQYFRSPPHLMPHERSI